ncbi:K02A2.6-like [Cordylochernes scorpioides]|uniref:RNA-directed DNA polymerase n=1 Tax=Cordylochernes scorpioides TaxID=51811 RepID=A0ABY6LA24_9ARAC|nr:K02A2.6-like [Cordylochernes scorpioides]
MCSYYRKFIKDFSLIADPLTSVIRKNVQFIWTGKQEKAFQNLKKALMNPPILGHFDPNAATCIHTDASNIGLGATLIQNIGGEKKVISYLSRTLSKPEQNYSTTEKECLAVVWSISKLWPYLYGRNFKIVTDHHALCWLKNLKDPTGRLARWALKIQEYNFEIIHKSGKKHLEADGLSRGPLPENEWDEDYERLFLNQIIDEKDDFIENIKENLSGNKRSITQNFKEENGCLYKKNPNPEGREWLLAVPKKRSKEIMSEYHNHMLNGHLGVARTTYRLKNKYYWPSMLKDVSEFVKTCHLCQSRKGSNQLPSGLLQPIPPANYPFERIGIDFVGPLPSTKRRRKWIIVLTDYYTKYAETKAVPETTVKEVSTFLIEHIFLRHGAPRFLISDRGSQFTSNLMKETNGLTERLNRTLINMISMYVNTDQKNWDEILPFITHAYNTTIQETTGYSPFFLLFGREPMSLLDDENIPTDSNMDDYDEYIENYLDKIAKTRQVVINNTEKTQERMKRNYDKKHNERIYEPGHLVAVWTPVRKIRKCEKLLRKYFGPYRILKKLSNVNYLIEPKDNPGQDPLIVHVSRIKPYFERIDEVNHEDVTTSGEGEVGRVVNWLTCWMLPGDELWLILEMTLEVVGVVDLEEINGLGQAKINYKISLQPDAKPYALCTPRRVPIPLMKQLKEQLEEMTRLGVIESVEEPTEWCAGMVAVPKPGGKLRIWLGNACYFSKLDANPGFWQIGLAEESQNLTTIITPFGRFFFKRIPFRISSAPEIFQRKMTQLLGKIEGVVCFMDDIVVYGSSLEEHNERVRQVLKKFQEEGMTLNPEKPNLALYTPSGLTIISADASSFGIGGVLRQEQPDESLKPVAYLSRILSETERRYSQIEKEGLAIVWTCEGLKYYVTGFKIHIETDHKPLIANFISKPLEDITPRLQRLKMRMKPISKRHKDEREEELSAYIQCIEFPATEERLLENSRKQKEDSHCSQVANYCTGGWPKNKKEVDPEIRGYWQFQDDLTYQNGLLLRGQRILIPRSMRKEILEKLHQGHFGINKCRSRAKESVCWLGISQEIKRMVSSCTKCLKERIPKHEALMPSEFPIRPWQKVGMDLFYLNGRWYLIVCDYYYRFSKEWSLKHITSSPRFPQSNRFIEAIIKKIKQSLKKEEDCYLTLQAYRTMPLESGVITDDKILGLQSLARKREKRMINQKPLYDKRHDVHSLPQLQHGDSVWIRDQRVEGEVLHKSQEPRSYWVQTPQGKVRRNRLHLTRLPTTESTMDASEDSRRQELRNVEAPPPPFDINRTYKRRRDAE